MATIPDGTLLFVGYAYNDAYEVDDIRISLYEQVNNKEEKQLAHSFSIMYAEDVSIPEPPLQDNFASPIITHTKVKENGTK